MMLFMMPKSPYLLSRPGLRQRRFCVTSSSPFDSSDAATAFGFSRRFEEDYRLRQCIGKGGFAQIFLATTLSGENHAVKVIKKKMFAGRVDGLTFKRIQNEADALQALAGSLNVVQLHGVYEDESSVYLALELCGGGDLDRRRRSMPLGQFDEAAACCIAHEALSGIAQCHARGIAHLDIKPANFLFLDPSSSRMRMIDFGLAAYCSPGQILTEKVGSFPYISPDVLRQAYGLPSDLWSYGVVLFECLSGRLPFKSEDEDYLTCDSKLRSKDWSIAITSGTLGWDDAGLSSDALDLLQRLLTRDPNKRISATDALLHPWFKRDRSLGMASKGYSGLKPYSIEINSVVQRLQRWASTNRLKRVALSRIMSHLQDRKPLLSPLLSFPPMSVLDDDCFDLSRSEKDRLLSPFFSAEERAKVNQWNSALADWGSIKDKLGPEEWSSLVDDIFSSFYSLDHSAIEMELSFDELEGAICGSSEDECAVPNILSQSLRGLGHNEKPNNVRYSSAEFHSLLSSEEDLSIFEDRVTLDTSLLTS